MSKQSIDTNIFVKGQFENLLNKGKKKKVRTAAIDSVTLLRLNIKDAVDQYSDDYSTNNITPKKRNEVKKPMCMVNEPMYWLKGINAEVLYTMLNASQANGWNRMRENACIASVITDTLRLCDREIDPDIGLKTQEEQEQSDADH